MYHVTEHLRYQNTCLAVKCLSGILRNQHAVIVLDRGFQPSRADQHIKNHQTLARRSSDVAN